LSLYLALTLSLWLGLVSPARAHDASRPIPLRDVEFDQKLNSQIPLDLSFMDERGVPVQLRQYLGGKPIMLNFVYYKCRDLCPLLLDGIVRTLHSVSFDIGVEFDVLTVSIDPSDTAALAAAQKKDFVGRYGRVGSERGWHFLTGEEAAIRSSRKPWASIIPSTPKPATSPTPLGLCCSRPQAKPRAISTALSSHRAMYGWGW